MRLILLFCLVCGPVATLWGETPQKTNETDLARSYYSALNKTGKSGKADEAAALKAVEELKKRFPEDAITHIVAEHWEQRNQQPELSFWAELKPVQSKRDQKEPAAVVVVSYSVADLIVPADSQADSKTALQENAETLIDLISDSCFRNGQKESAVFYDKTLSIVIRGTTKSQAACQRILSQLRKQQDVQLSYEITIASVPAELANLFPLREILSPAVFAERKKLIRDSPQAGFIMSPKVTLFNDQIAGIAIGGIEFELHGKTTNDHRAIRTEWGLVLQARIGQRTHKFASSELIPDGQTAAFFIQTEEVANAFFDRRLLIENGIDVKPSTANQLYLFLTPRILILDEEEELLGQQQKSKPQKAVWSVSGKNPGYLTFPYHPSLPLVWTPVKLDWDDGAWDLDFAKFQRRTPNYPWNLTMPAQATKQLYREYPKSFSTLIDEISIE